MPLNVGGLQAAFAKHRTQILVGGAAAVSAAGLYVHHKNAGAASANTAATNASGAAASPIAGTAGYDPTAGVDTSATDVYNALQPQMAQEQSLLAQLIDALKNQAPKPTTPKPPAPKPPTGTTSRRKSVNPPKSPVSTTRKLPPKGPTRKSPAPTRHYVVKKGDNLTSIARRFGTTWSKIYAANKALIGRNPNLIYPGQNLVIP